MEKIKQLREITGAGMVDCKKALDESNGDIDKAVEILRKKGIAKAAKRTDRETSEGVIKVDTNDEKTEGYIIETSSETDFVAKNDKFQKFSDDVLNLIKKEKPADNDAMLNLSMETGTVKENLDNLSGVIGEKLDIKRFGILASNGMIEAYNHMDGKIGVLVSLSGKVDEDIARGIAMQVAATNPGYIRPDEVPEEIVEKEKEIYREQLKKEGKPEQIIEKILDGKINKYFEEVCLEEQEYIKDDKKKVKDILGSVKIEKFVRYSLLEQNNNSCG